VAFDKIPARVRNLASNGEEIMFCQRGGVLRSASQAIVNYSISCFHLCNHTCKEIRGCVSNYRYLHASFSSCRSSNGGKIERSTMVTVHALMAGLWSAACLSFGGMQWTWESGLKF
jgi:hypothetical protein